MSNIIFGKFKRKDKRVHKQNASPFPLKFEPLDRCPECGARVACYGCVTSGGWMSQADWEKSEHEMDQERSPY